MGIAPRHAALLLQVTIAPREKYPLGQTVLKVNEQRERTHMFTRRYLEEQLYTTLAGQQHIPLTSVTNLSAYGISRHPVCIASAWHEENCLILLPGELPSMSQAGVGLSDEWPLLRSWHAWKAAAEVLGASVVQGGPGRR